MLIDGKPIKMSIIYCLKDKHRRQETWHWLLVKTTAKDTDDCRL